MATFRFRGLAALAQNFCQVVDFGITAIFYLANQNFPKMDIFTLLAKSTSFTFEEV